MNGLLSTLMTLLRRVNLWPRLVLAVSIGFLALFAILGLLTLRAVDDSHEHILQERLLVAQMAVRQVDNYLERAFPELEGAAASAPLQAQDPDSNEVSEELAGMLEGTDDVWLGLYLLDAQGDLVAAAPVTRMQEPFGPSQDPAIRQTMATGDRGVSAPYRDGVTGRPAAMLVVPITDGQGGSEFVLGGVVDLSHAEFVRSLDDARNVGETGHAELIDGRGRVIASTDPIDFLAPGEHLEFYLRMQDEGSEGVETVLYEPRHPIQDGYDYGDDHHIMAFAHLTNAPWGLAVGGSESETLAPVISLRNQILLIGAVSLVVLWVVTLVGARLLVRPVRILTSAADRIAAGNLETPIRVVEGGEIGRLGETLEAMRIKLRTSLEEISRWGKKLETKVAERTGELKARNRQLTALAAVATAANESPDLPRMLERCLDIVLEHTGMEAGAVRLLDRESGRLVAACYKGEFKEFPCWERAIVVDECPCGHVATTGRPIAGHPAKLQDAGRRPCLAPGLNFTAILPLKSSEGVQGVLYVATKGGHTLDGQHMEMLTVMCNQIGVAIENAQLFRDLSKMEAQRELHRLKSEFMSAVSHELRTPLGFIKGYVTTLLRDDLTADPETQREFHQIISEESDKLQGLIDDLLDASKLRSGGLTLSRTSAKVGKIAEQAIEKLRTTFPERELLLDLPPQEPEVLVDPWRIEQVIQNLVDNAVRYSPPGKPVNVRVQFEGPEVVVSVRDRGDGMTAQDSRRVFEPFYRGRRGTDRSPVGTGLGLTICRGIVEAHGGRIWVESRRGRGSTFYFSLPLVASDLGGEGMEPEIGVAGGREAAKTERSSPRRSRG
jgi:two-component system sensor histidine kinase KdpD